MVTIQQLRQLIPGNPYVQHWYTALCAPRKEFKGKSLLEEYEINNPKREAAFFAQCIHESGGFIWLTENLNYKAAGLMRVFPKYFPDMATALKYEKQPDKIANRVYANRMGNGPEESGDGAKFKGRGLIQVTGKDNYFWFAASLQITPEEAAEYMQTFEGAAQSACWFWETNNLNKLADAGDIKQMTRVINGGFIGLQDREHHYAVALTTFNTSDTRLA